MWPFAKGSESRPAYQLPLFPLKTVLFPGGLLPLKIFEQRYIEMAKTCLKDDRPFGVCLLMQGDEVGRLVDEPWPDWKRERELGFERHEQLVVIEAVEPKDRREHLTRVEVEPRSLAGDRAEQPLEHVEEVQVAARTDLVEVAAILRVEQAQRSDPGERLRHEGATHVEHSGPVWRHVDLAAGCGPRAGRTYAHTRPICLCRSGRRS